MWDQTIERDQLATFVECFEVLKSAFTSLTHLFPLHVALDKQKTYLFLNTQRALDSYVLYVI